jgi:sugar phosphate isomerase/epimerase
MILLSGFGDEISPDLEIQLDVLVSEGFSYLDLRSVNDINILKLTNKEIMDIKKRLDARGFKVSSIASPIGKISITDDFDTHLNDFMRAIQLAKYFETPYIRIFSFYIPKEEDPYKYREQVLRRMVELTQIAEKEGVLLVLENEKDLYGDNGARARDILEHVNSPHLRFLFDPANFVQVQVQPMTDAYPYVKDFIEYVHIKDALMKTGEVVPPGEGDGELRALIAALKERNYSGFMSIEPHLEATGQYVGYSNPQLFRIAAQALKQLLSEAGVEWNKHPNSTNEAAVLPPPCISAQAGLLDFWLPLTPPEEMEKTYYDVLIVGSGAGGGAALWRLCDQLRNNGKKVGVIEAGNPYLPTHAANLAILSGGRASQYISNPEITRQVGQSLPQFSGAKQIIALGGRTIQWGAASPRMPWPFVRLIILSIS